MIERLTYSDIDLVVSALPNEVRDLLEASPNLWIAGGFIRDLIMGVQPNDIDIWGSDGWTLGSSASMLQKRMDVKSPTSYFQTENADTVRGHGTIIQFIKRWTFNSPEELINSFDYECCAAAVWHDGNTWQGICTFNFKLDCRLRNLTYTQPKRDEDKMGSLKRLLKFMSKGWKIDDSNLSKVMGRTIAEVYDDEREASDYFYTQLQKLASTGGY